MPRPPLSAGADTDSTHRAGSVVIPGTELPVQVNLRIESKTERDLKLRCNSTESAQISAVSGCNAGFLPPALDFKGTFKAAGTIGDRMHVNVDYDMQREFDASQTVSAYYEGAPGSAWQRVDVGNIAFAPPPSRFMTSSLPSGNYGIQLTNQFGALKVKSIFAKQTGNVVQNRKFTIGGGGAQQLGNRDVSDYQIERLRFFFTIDPGLLGGGRAYPNIDILNRAQLQSLRSTLPDTLRPTRVLVYRLQFGTQPQNPKGPQFKLRDSLGATPRQGQQTYDLLREGVDYYMDPSLLWFALVRPLNETNERIVVAYNVRLNGSRRDTVWTTTGGTPDLQVTSGPQIANLVMDPDVGPSSPAFRNEIRSVYRVAGEDLVRSSTKVRVVTGDGLLEHPIAGSAATFLQMFGLSQATSPAEFDYENRLWPRQSDPVFNLGAGAIDVRAAGAPGATPNLDIAHIIHDYFLVFPSLQPFAARDSGGLVLAGNHTNAPIYTIPGEYLYSPQHPASVYRIHLEYRTTGTDESGAITLGATQMRRGSERVVVDGRPLVRDLDYRIDYDLGRVEFTRPDTVLSLERHVEIGYEENPVFAASPTTLAGVVSELPVPHGVLNFAAIDQSQSTPFTRPQLGFQGNSTLTAGVTGKFDWDAPALTSLVNRLPFMAGSTKAPSHISITGEFATSHPQFLARNQGSAYVETFEQGAGVSIALGDIAWYYSSLPAYGHSLRSTQFSGMPFDTTRASTLAWQSNVQTPGGQRIVFQPSQIDPLSRFAGSGIELNEPVLWLTLLPLDQAGRYNRRTHGYDWHVGPAFPSGRRFRSIRTVLSPSGIDLTNGEFLQFWTLLDTSDTARLKNPTLIFDFGDVSENSLVFGPDTLTITHRLDGGVDSTFSGRKLQGFDTLNTERDTFSHAFNVDVNDTGLPGDVVDLVVIDGASVRLETKVRICRSPVGALTVVGDPQADCTIGNNKLDEEDIDQDNAMNFFNADRERERLLRYVVDLSDTAKYKRVGGTYTDTLFVQGQPTVRTRQWVLVSVPFKTPTESLNDVNRRRLRALRLTVVSGAQPGTDEEPTQFPIAELRVTGAPWLDRSSQTLAGVAGIGPDVGSAVITSTVGTNDSGAPVNYQSPPGIVDQAATKAAQFQGTLTQINESSMRIQTVNLPLYHRAEAYFRFPTGPQFFLGYRELRVWGRGRGNGWGTGGDLQMYIKVGRDENNFYMYRTPVNQAAWSDIPIDFSRFTALRKKVQSDYLSGKTTSIACTGVDSAIVTASPVPVGTVVHRFAACDNAGYMIYTVDPAVTPPNLASVQEMAVGILRVNSTGSVSPGDTLELWVDDIRLDQQVNAMGMAGQVSLGFNAADFLDVRMSVGNRDPNFRQLGEQATFLGQQTVDMSSTVRLDKLLPAAAGVSLPLTITKSSLADNPLYLSQTDLAGSSIDGLRKPKDDLTTYSLSLRRTKPLTGVLGPLLNNLSATSSYTTGVDRTEYQDGASHNFTADLDYLIIGDSARTLRLPSWINALLGGLPGALQAGPLSTLNGTAFRWNPTQIRLTTGVVQGNDRRVSFLLPTGLVADQPALSTATSRLWRNGSTIALRPTTGFDVRLEIQSVRDLRDYGDTTDLRLIGPVPQHTLFGANAGFERERTMLTSLSFAPVFSAWFHPRGELGTQYDMLRDPNVQSYTPLPGVIGVDSVLATRDSSLAAHPSTLLRRMTAAQTASVGTGLDLARAFATYSRDSSVWRRLGSVFAPIDVSYTRSLLSSLDAAPVGAPLLFQLGFGGPASFRAVNGVDATLAGQTGTLSASGSLLLPFGTSLANRYRRTTTANWIARPDSTQAEADGTQTQFPDVQLRWTYRPAGAIPSGIVSNLDANVGYVRSDATISLPSFADDSLPALRHTHIETFPVGGTIIWSLGGALSTGARYALTRRVDSLPGSVARTHGDEVSVDAGRAFRIPSSWGFGIKNEIRTRFGIQQTHTSTFVYDELGTFQSRLQDNGRQAFNLTADTNLSDNMVFTLQGSHIVTFDNNLAHRFAQTVFSTVLQIQFFGTGK
jgi:cell surface protein SprA